MSEIPILYSGFKPVRSRHARLSSTSVGLGLHRFFFARYATQFFQDKMVFRPKPFSFLYSRYTT